MESFTIAIVGRPNVGKSTLFNKLIKKQKSIVAKHPGTTRDFQVEKIDSRSHSFNVMDTAGFEMKKSDPIYAADAYLFMCDGQTPITELDHELLSNIRKLNKPCLYAVNKIDTTYFKEHEVEFHAFLGSTYVQLAAEKNIGLTKLINAFEEKLSLPDVEPTAPAAYRIKVAIMGRPNVGKSTLMNQLLSKERVIVSPIPGTTIDSIDSAIEVNHQKYLFIDTAGLRKKRNVVEKVEKMATYSAINALERANILLLVIDACEGPREQDVQLAKLAWKRGVAVILLINKWDLLPQEKKTNTYWQKVIWYKFRHFNRIPFLFISATEKRNIDKIFEAISQTKAFHEQVIEPKKLNETFLDWTHKTTHPMIKKELGKRSKVNFYSMKQTKNAPPYFEVKTNYADQITDPYDRFLKTKLRETFGFWGIPIEITYKKF